MDNEIRGWCVGCRRHVPPPPQGVVYGANRIGSPYMTYPCPRGHEVRWFIKWRADRELPPPPGPAEAEARAQLYAGGVRQGLQLGQRKLDGVARVMKVFGLLADFRMGLGVSVKTVNRMVDRAEAQPKSGDGP